MKLLTLHHQFNILLTNNIIIDDNVTYFGLPIFFFRSSFTSAVSHVSMAYVQWIPFIVDKEDRTTFIGRINVANWNAWPTAQTFNPFIATSNLQPSRYALAFEPPTELAVFVDVGFIALDAENLCETNNDRFTTDFGDNKFPNFKGRGSQHSQDQLEEEDEQNEEANQGASEVYETLQSYLPNSVLKFLLDPDPLRIINQIP